MNGSSSQMSDIGAVIAGMLGVTIWLVVFLVMMAVMLALIVFIVICNWKILEKAGEPGWKAIIPFYNMYTFCDISMTKPTSIVVFVAWAIAYAGCFLCAIPYLGILISLVISPVIYATTGILNFSIPKAFGKDVGICVLSIFFPPIVRAILAFSKDTEFADTKVTIIPASNQ